MRTATFLAFLVACDESSTTTERVEVAATVQRVEVVVGTPGGPLCPRSTPYQLHVCQLDSDGLGTEVCIEASGTLIDGCLCWDSTGTGIWDCDIPAPEGYEYRLAWWEAAEM